MKSLAEQLRPKQLSELVGQRQLLAEGSLLSRFLQAEAQAGAIPRLPSLLLWGPPGSGKTTVARLLAQASGLRVEATSAVFTGVGAVKKIFAAAARSLEENPPRRTCLFVDELHRFNKAQQDGFLGAVEEGLITLLGATTENPSFAINAPLLSRMQVLTLVALEREDLLALLKKAERHLGLRLPLTPAARERLLELADGDGRRLLNLVESLKDSLGESSSAVPLDAAALSKLVQHRFFRYDQQGEEHYNLISALHKALRGSDPDAALYWLSRMMQGGEDPHYLARRLLRFAYEDIGLAEPQAAVQVLSAWQTYERLGSPEGEIALAQATLFLAVAPKSNRVYVAAKAAQHYAKKNPSLPPPKHLLNAPTAFMKQQGYAAGYRYDPDTKLGFSGQAYFPEALPRQTFYHPVQRGFEREVMKRLAYFKKLRQALSSPQNFPKQKR